jgi:tetratricopeptide (TPR) repeat protein
VAVSQAGYLFMLRRHDEAEKVYLEALEIEKRSEIYANLARLYMQQNRPEDAIAPIEQAIRIDPQMENQLKPMLENARRAAAAKEAAEQAKAAGLPVPEPDEQAIFSDNFESGRLDRWDGVEFGHNA